MKSVLKMAFLLVALSALAPACGNSEGSSCSKTDDCGGGFICQPIQGRSQLFCCPAPATASDNANCHPASS